MRPTVRAARSSWRPPGIGKTRLAREALAEAKQRGFTALEGHAYPLGVGLAYAPILDAFDPLLRRLDADRLGSLVSDLPDLGRLFGGLNLPQSSFSGGLGDHALEKTRLFWAVARLIERLAQGAPVVLFIDDVHWADSATLELLHFIARGLADQRVLLLATFSSNTPGASPGLQQLLGQLQKDGLAEEIVVARIGQGAMELLVRGVLEGDAPCEFMALLEARARGVPLFAKAFIAALIDSANLVRSPSEKDGWVFDAEGASTIPPSVRRLILERLDRLGPTDRHVIELIAVMGDATTHTVLRAASGLDEETLIESLRRLIAGGLIVEGSDRLDSISSIAHPLIQEVADAELPGAARRRAHAAAIKAIESLSEGRQVDVNRLARHYRGAGIEASPGRTLEVLLAAGERARAIYANEEAARHYAAALALLREGGYLRGRQRGVHNLGRSHTNPA